MQPYDKERQDEIDAGWAALEYHGLGLTMTDDDVREMGLKEYKPGYFINDPRYPGWAVEDRYLYDHPGPDWKTKPPLADEDRPYERGMGKAQFRAEQRIYEPQYQSYADEQFRHQQDQERIPEAKSQVSREKFSGVWLCRSCRKQPALWPREKAWRWKIWGVTGTIVFRSPLACTDCRVFNFRVIRALGRQDHRPFWNQVFAFLAEPLPVAHRIFWTWKHPLNVLRRWCDDN